MRHTVRKLGLILYSLGIKSAERMRNKSWLIMLEERMAKRDVLKEIRKREQEIKDYKTKQRS